MKKRNLKPRILDPPRLSFRLDGDSKSFTDKQKLREFSITKPVLQQMLKELLKARGQKKRRPQLEIRKSQMGNLTSKGKHTVKEGNHPHTNMISKPATIRRGEYKCRKRGLHLKFRDQQRETILYRLLYQNHMGTSNQKTTVDTHTKRKSNPNITLKIVIKPQENKTER